jgi:hypothetical protein
MRGSNVLFVIIGFVVIQLISFTIWRIFDTPLHPLLPPHSAAQDDLDPRDNTVIIYNRIPKTGSTSFMHLPYELCEQNDYNVLLMNISHPHFMTLNDRVFFAQNISSWRGKLPAIYHGHFAFVDLHNMGVNTGSTNFVYINVIRQPLDRFDI